ncbi:MAG: hypothetical protein RBS73_00745 [Prolixibacteraceae bacterium]|jgi:hypothetical protein|nr:hypothetical protein [Prolixibacteraceae bacterium]
MFTGISWTDYFIAVAVLLTGYYFFVGMRYYSADLKDLFSGKRKLKFRKASNIPETDKNFPSAEKAYRESTDPNTIAGDDQMEVEYLTERLTGVIAEASGKSLSPDEFKLYLSLVLREYSHIKNSPLRFAVNELIASQCKKYGAVALSEQDAEQLWEDVL